ncbi:type II toxin-antitoxin system HicA family toxin [Patescibacteria group bacterium]|nr:type II toxin-antitoxin system HicA family toxin [Patescibacteria group bacterium]
MSKYNLTPSKLIKLLRKHGFVFSRQSGSHAIFKNEQKNLKVVVPIHNKDIPKGTLCAILKDADIQL